MIKQPLLPAFSLGSGQRILFMAVLAGAPPVTISPAVSEAVDRPPERQPQIADSKGVVA